MTALELHETDSHKALPAYVCPDCKSALIQLYCPECQHDYPLTHGIPQLLSRDMRFLSVDAIAAEYDELYGTQSGVWENQGRTPEFIRYFASLLNNYPASRFLEIGCGEGFLLSAIKTTEVHAIDISLQALRKAKSRARASVALALSERLPFPNDHFDLVTSIGVMEHFLDIGEALQEIRRVLRPSGYYISLTHVQMVLADRIVAKVSEFVFPRPHPIRFARWIHRKFEEKLPVQPIQHRYSAEEAHGWLERSGFDLIDVLHRRRDPALPFIGPYVMVYIAQKGTMRANRPRSFLR